MHVHHQLPSSALAPLNPPETQRAIAARSAAVTRKRLAFYASIWQLDDAASDASSGNARRQEQQSGRHGSDAEPTAGNFSVTV